MTKVRFSLIRTLFFVGVSFLTFACGKTFNKLSTVTLFSTTSQLNSTFKLSVYKLDTTGVESEYVGTVVRNGDTIEWPTVIKNHLATSPTSVTYIVKAYSTSSVGDNGDFYYEAPILSNSPSFNGAATALWWAMKYSSAALSSRPIIDQSKWESALFLLNVACPSCLRRSGSYSYQQLAANVGIRNAINSLNGISLIDPTIIASAPVGVAYTSPVAVGGNVNLTAAQGDTKAFEVAYFDPLNTSSPTVPDSWNLVLGSSSVLTSVTGRPQNLNYSFNYVDLGAMTVKASKTVRGVTLDVNYNYNVTQTLRAPTFSIPTQNFQANHKKQIDLSAYATDPNGGTLSYVFVDAPSGATLSGSTIEWNPTQYPDTQVGTSYFTLNITNSAGITTTSTIQANVVEDHYPDFSAGLAAILNLTEGSSFQFNFSTLDADGDPIEISCKSALDGRACETFLYASNPDGSLVPAGSNWPSLNKAIHPSYYGGSVGTETVSFPFIPSYLQVLTALTGDYPIIFSINYKLDNAGSLRSLLNPKTTSTILHISNIADAPTWTVQPGPAANPAGTENIAIAPVLGAAADDAAINPGSHTISFAFDSASASPSGSGTNCAWISVNSVTGAISGTPTYNSAATCNVLVRAIDPLGIYTLSSPVALNITDVPRALTAVGSISEIAATENVRLSTDLSSYFSSADSTAHDPRAVLTLTCTNCAAKGITGVTFRNAANTDVGTFLTYTPGYDVAPSGGNTLFSGLNILATLTNGNPAQDRTATQTLDIRVADALAPMSLTLADGTLVLTSPSGVQTASLNALTTGNLSVNVTNLAGDSSNYPYTLSASCSSCTGSMLSFNSTSATGAHAFTLSLNPVASDGYGGATASSKKQIVTIILTGPPGLSAQTTFNVMVGTIDRPATGLSMSGDGGTGTYTKTINGSNFSDNTITLALLSPDASNDTLSYAFDTGVYPAFGSISGAAWRFNPLAAGCSPGTDSITKTFKIMGSSNRTASYTRTVTVTIQNTTVGAGGSCPY